jgi:pyrroline-5-carboxylate reductase
MTLALLGAGRLGVAVLSGLLRSGFPSGNIIVAERDPARAAEVAKQHGVVVVDAVAAATKADVLLLAVKPQDMGDLADSLADVVGREHLVVSVAAGVTTAFLERRLPAGPPVVRVMTNTPLLVGEAMSAIAGGTHTTDDHLATAEQLLAPVGRVVRVPESQLDAVTALSGSGPAYFFYLTEAMIDAGVALGLPRALATELTVQTALGAARMLRETGEHPALLREAVTSPGGTTAAAVRELERHAVRAAVIDALDAARARSGELGGSDEPGSPATGGSRG